MTIFIFFAHSIQDYNTDYEQLCIDVIKKEYPEAIIINPRDIMEDKGLTKEEIKKLTFWEIEYRYFFPEIMRCELVIVAKCWTDPAWRKKFTPGVLAEIEYAKKLGKSILEFGE